MENLNILRESHNFIVEPIRWLQTLTGHILSWRAAYDGMLAYGGDLG